MKKLRLPSFSWDYIPLLSAFFLLVIIKILISFYFKSPWIFADETVYAETARNILHGEFYSKLQYCQTYPPGYSLFLSIAYLFSSVLNYQFMLIINAFITSSIIFPSFFILKKSCSDKFSIFGSILIAILPSVFLYNFVIMSENLFIPLFTFSLWFLIESFETNSKKWGILAGFSIFLLYFTRSTGIAMILGFFFTFSYFILIQSKMKRPVTIVKENICTLLSFCIPTVFWIYYKSHLEITSGSDYNTAVYSSILFQSLSNIESFTKFLSLTLHEVEFLISASFFILFVLAMFLFYLIFSDNSVESSKIMGNQKSLSVKCGAIYSIVSSILLIIITVAHMLLGLSENNLDYYIFGRYLDPIIPIIVIFGLIGTYKILSKNFDKMKITISSIIIGLFLIILFAIDFPTTRYKFPNMFSVFYIKTVNAFLPSVLVISLLILSVFCFFIIIVYYKKFWPLFIIFLIIISTASIYSTLRIQIKESSNAAANINQIGQYLIHNSNESSRILMTVDDFSTGKGIQIWFGTQFYINGYLIRKETSILSNNSYYNQPRDFQYILSTKSLPYHLVAKAKTGFNLYDFKEKEN